MTDRKIVVRVFVMLHSNLSKQIDPNGTNFRHLGSEFHITMNFYFLRRFSAGWRVFSRLACFWQVGGFFWRVGGFFGGLAVFLAGWRFFLAGWRFFWRVGGFFNR